MKVAGPVALVTGGASGIGWGIADRLAAEGASLQLDSTPVGARRRCGQHLLTRGDRAGPALSPRHPAAKAGVVRRTSSLGFLAERLGVRVNAICPDWVDTPASRRSRASMSDEELAELPTILKPSEVAAVALSLIEDETAVGRTVVVRCGQAPWTLVYEQAAARLSSNERSRWFRVSEAARSNSARASAQRPSLARRSPRTLGKR